MKVGCSSWTFDMLIRAGEMTLLDFISVVSALGVSGVELLDHHFPSTTSGYLKQLTQQAERDGVEIAAVAISNKFGFPDEAKRDEALTHIRKFMDIAIALGAHSVRVFTGENRSPEKDYDAQKQWVLDALLHVAEYAEKLELPVGIENHDSVCKSADEILWLLDEINSPYVGSCPDPINFLPPRMEGNREVIYDETEKLAPFAVHAHAKFVGFDESGRDVYLDYERLMRIFSEAEYEGYQSIEYRTPNPVETLPPAIALLSRCIAEAVNNF